MSKVLSAQDGKIDFNKGFLGIFKPKDFDKINTALQMYNIRVQAADGRSKSFAENLAKINPELSNYLVSLKGAEGTMKGYGVHLVGATIKTVALQAASMALNAALTWGVSLAIQGIIAGVQALWKLVPTTEHLKEKLEETAQALADIKSETESINSELETTQQRINELEAKGVLSFTEETELTRLKQENAELERKLVLLDEERKIKSKEQQGTFKRVVKSDYFNGYEFKSRYIKTQSPTTGNEVAETIQEHLYIDEQFRYLDELKEKLKTATKDELEKIKKEIEKTEKYLSEEISTSQGYLDALEEAGYIYGTDAEVDKYIDWIYEFQDKYLVAVGNTSELFNSVINRDRFSEARTAIEELANAGNLTAESLQNLYNQGGNVKEFIDYMLSLNTVDWKTMLGDKFTDVAEEDGIVSLDEALKAMSDDTALASIIMGLFSNELNKVEDAAKGTSTEIKSLSNSLSEIEKISDKFSKLGSAISELKEDGYVSIKTINEIAEAFKGTEGLDEYISQIATASNTKQLQKPIQGLINSYLNQESVLKGLDATNKQVLITQLKRLGVTNAEEVINAKINQNLPGLTQNMKDFNKHTSQEAASLYALAKGSNIAGTELKKYAQIVEKVNEIERLEAEAKKSKAYDSHIYAWRINNIRKDIANIVDSINISPMDTDVKIKINMSGLEELNGSGSDNSGSETNKTAENKIKNLKHRHEMGLISEATYYKELEKIRKKYYAGKKKYLDRDRQLQEEYHDWEVKNAEDGFEKKVEALQEKYANGKITYAKLKSEIKKLINKTFKNDKDTKNKYLDELPDYLSDAKEKKEEKNREKFDSSYDKFKYQLENGFITEATYYKKLDALYKKHYGDKTKYLDEYAQYSQEVYDGFKEMYKKDYEAQKESLEKQKEEITEYYDDLIEKKREEHDAEDYEKEQSEKRKKIFDIDMQIAELMRDGSEKAKARIAELEEERKDAAKELEDFEKDHAREKEIERLEKEKEAREKAIEKEIKNIDEQLEDLNSNTKDIREAVIRYAKAKGVDIKFAYASGTRSSVGGFGRINEKGIEMISAPDGNGNYVNLMPDSYVFSAKATEFLWKLATEHSLPQAMYNSIAKSIKTQSSTPSVNIAQPITITMGDIIIKGNADKQTVADIKKQQENTVRMVLQKIKELQK